MLSNAPHAAASGARCGAAVILAAPATLPFGAYRLIDYLVAASSTVGEGVLRFARFFHRIAEALTLRVVEGPDEQVLCLTTVVGDPVPPVYVDYVFAALVSRIRMRIRAFRRWTGESPGRWRRKR